MINFLRVQDKYYHHLRDKSETFLPRIYGVYQIIIPSVITVNFMFMANFIQPLHPEKYLLTFDLKGFESRYTKRSSSNPGNQILKDKNLILLTLHMQGKGKQGTLFFGFEEVKNKKNVIDKIMEVLDKDTEFLEDNNFMNYSLIFGIEYDIKDA